MGNSALRTDEEITRVYNKYVDTVYRVCFMMLKSASLTRSAVGRVSMPSGVLSCTPRAFPVITRMDHSSLRTYRLV